MNDKVKHSLIALGGVAVGAICTILSAGGIDRTTPAKARVDHVVGYDQFYVGSVSRIRISALEQVALVSICDRMSGQSFALAVGSNGAPSLTPSMTPCRP